MKRLISLTIFVVAFVSCDCHQNVSGTVIDEQTKVPLENVIIYKTNDKQYTNTVTDSLGNFELSDISGGPFGCPPMEIVIEAEGYVVKADEIESGGSKVIELEKLKI